MFPRSQIARQAFIIALSLVTLFTVCEAQAATLSVPSQHSTIGAALNSARSGDLIEIAPGIYPEYGLTVPSGVTLSGTGASPQDVVIDGMGAGRIMLVESAAETVTFRNLLFTDGMARGVSGYDQCGGAIFINNSMVRIENCVFSANHADSQGGAVRFANSGGEVVSCEFNANAAMEGGGGAIDFSYNSSPLVTDCVFQDNQASWGGALSCRGGSSPRVERSELTGNIAGGNKGFGGGVFADTQSSPDLVETVVAENLASFGGGLACWTDGAINLDYCTVVYNEARSLEGGMLVIKSSPAITGSIIAFNMGRGVSVSGASDIQVTCTNMFGNTSGNWALPIDNIATIGGNLSVDPQFCTIGSGQKNRFALQATSPLAQNPNGCGVLGARPVSCSGDLSPVEVPQATLAIEKVMAAPNPFNPRTEIRFELSRAQDLRVAVYGIDGRLVRTLGDGSFHSGAHELVWTGRDQSGRQVSSGQYFVILKGQEETRRLKITLLK